MKAETDGSLGSLSFRDLWQDILLGSIFVALGAYALYRINFIDIPVFSMSTGALNYATVPSICAAGILILASLYTANSVRRLVAVRKAPPLAGSASGIENSEGRSSPLLIAGRRLATLALLVSYTLLLKSLPFILATALFLATMFLIFGQKSPLRIGLVAIIGAGALHLLFVEFLKLPF